MKPDIASWLREALVRAAKQPGAWTPRRVHARTCDVEALCSAGYVRRVGTYSSSRATDAPLYEITAAGRSLLA